MSVASIVERPISGLRPYGRNARIHSKKQIKQIADSITRFGFTNPVLIADDGQIIAGHGRVEAAKQLGWTTVPTLALSHPDPEVGFVQRRPGIAHDVPKIAVRRSRADRQLALHLQAEPGDRTVPAAAVDDEVVERLASVALLKRHPADDAAFQARSLSLREEAGEILSHYVVTEGEACAACEFGRLRHSSIV